MSESKHTGRARWRCWCGKQGFCAPRRAQVGLRIHSARVHKGMIVAPFTKLPPGFGDDEISRRLRDPMTQGRKMRIALERMSRWPCIGGTTKQCALVCASHIAAEALKGVE
jgi:hypothetical protein